ncbi:MAG: menaquinone biosynthesis protein [Acidobacteriaceae bacterium]
MPLRVSTIAFLNPAPLLYNFEHEPTASSLRAHYDVHYTQPSICAAELNSGAADLGLIPIASLTPSLAIVPGCTIASRDEVRSILLLIKNPHRLSTTEALQQVRTVAADTASRSSVAYTRILFEHFHHTHPTYLNLPADPAAMLASADAALLIGDPALLARERRSEIEAHRATIEASSTTPLLWLDLAHLWRELTGLPWVAAVWALRPESLSPAHITAQQLIADLTNSRDAGLSHTEDLVREWSPRLGLSPTTVRTYLTRNIHYTLDPDCLQAITLFRTLAATINALPPLPTLNLL